jgi:mannose-6-phosphate isomerase-like protein (cupin superfamily)
MTAHIRRADAAIESRTAEACWIAETLNDPNDPALSIARARVEPGVTTAWHRLRDVTERYLIVSGHGVVSVGDAAPTGVGPGDVVLIAPGVRQRIRNEGEVDLVFYALCTPRFTEACYEALTLLP